MLSIFVVCQMTCKPILHLSISLCLDTLFSKTKTPSALLFFLVGIHAFISSFLEHSRRDPKHLTKRQFIESERAGVSVKKGGLLGREKRADVPLFNSSFFLAAILTEGLLNPLALNAFLSKAFPESKSLKCVLVKDPR